MKIDENLFSCKIQVSRRCVTGLTRPPILRCESPLQILNFLAASCISFAMGNR